MSAIAPARGRAVTGLDLAGITSRQRTVWDAGDYSAVGTRITLVSERLCEAADLQAGTRVLDIAGGSGTTALAAARCGCEVVSLDFVASLQERARARAAAEDLFVEFVAGDAQALPFGDASFDAVVSAVGAMFAPDQRAVAGEMLRVCRPGGPVALAAWTPDGFIGGLLRAVTAHVPPPAGLASPLLWGSEDHVKALLADGVDEIAFRTRTHVFRFPSAEAFTEFFRVKYGPTFMAFAALDQDGRRALAEDITALVRRHARTGPSGAVAIPAEYLEVVARRRRG